MFNKVLWIIFQSCLWLVLILQGLNAPLNAAYIPRVTQYGLIGVSGDGGDVIISDVGGFANPAPSLAVPVTTPDSYERIWPTPCAGQWISDNSGGFTLPSTPTTMVFRRSFTVTPELIKNGSFGITYGVDDMATFVLVNPSHSAGVTLAAGLREKACQHAAFDGNLLDGKGVNDLYIYLINTISIRAHERPNYGYTGIYYAVSVAPKIESDTNKNPIDQVTVKDLKYSQETYDQRNVRLTGKIRKIDTVSDREYQFTMDDGTGLVLVSYAGSMIEEEVGDYVSVEGTFNANMVRFQAVKVVKIPPDQFKSNSPEEQ